MARIAVIIAAAGRSERFGGKDKKAFAKVDGRAVVLRAIELFCNRDDVAQTILAIAPEDMAATREKLGPNLGFMGVQLVEGGRTRCATIRLALGAVADDIEFVAVHDAARVCTPPALIDALFMEAAASGAAIPVAPLVGTIKRVSAAGVVDETVAREGLFEAQTPQVFRRAVIEAAYASLAVDTLTDDAAVVEASGHPVTTVSSDQSNLKITFGGDATLAAAILKHRPKPPPKRAAGPYEEAQW